MNQQQIQALAATFEGHTQQAEKGNEYWLARELQNLLGYGKWDNLQSVISRATTACELSAHAITDHFADAGKMIELAPSGAAIVARHGAQRNAGQIQPRDNVSRIELVTPRPAGSNRKPERSGVAIN